MKTSFSIAQVVGFRKYNTCPRCARAENTVACIEPEIEPKQIFENALIQGSGNLKANIVVTEKRYKVLHRTF